MNFTELDSIYGRFIKPKELAEFLGVDRRTVIKYAAIWGGVEVAPGTYRFFENRIMEVLNAKQNFEKRNLEIPGKCDGQRHSKTETIPGRDKKIVSKGRSLGNRSREGTGKGAFRDSHGVFGS
jgi:hypothetical protein